MAAHGRFLLLVGLAVVGAVTGLQIMLMVWALSAVVRFVDGAGVEMLYPLGWLLVMLVIATGAVTVVLMVFRRRRDR